MKYQTKLRTDEIIPNENICFPIGTILAVKNKYEKLDFLGVFDKHKKKGIDINSLIQALLSYKLTENLSISKASGWINRGEVLETFNIQGFEERTLFRTLETIGKNREEIISDIQDRLFQTYNFEHTDVKQITVGISELAGPINIPIGITINKGNLNDMKHFAETYDQIRDRLKSGSLITFDKGANSKTNIDLILADKMKYLTSKKLNKSDDKRIKKFDKSKAELVDAEKGVYGIKFVKPNNTDYFYFSESLQKDQLKSRARKALQKLKEAKEIQKSIDNNKKLPMKFRINNVLIDVSYSYQTKLMELSEEEALKLVEKVIINGREGFFCIKSSEDLTLQQALQTYRKKDSIEKIFNSMKNEIEIKPVRVWTDDSIYGALIIGFLAQLFISLIRYTFIVNKIHDLDTSKYIL
jgi:transposase